MADPIYGTVRRGAVADYNDGSTSQVAVNNRGDMLVAPSLLSKAELARLGRSWSCTIATGSAYTNVAGMPTTRAELALYNGDSTKSYIIDQVWFLSLTSIAAAANVSLIYQVGFPAALTDDAAQLINSPLGLTYSGRAKRAVAVTTMVANKWAVLAASGANASASIGTGIVANVDGGIILIPGATLGLNAVAGTAAGTSLIGVSWHEVELPR
jgi:hypothetical protein